MIKYWLFPMLFVSCLYLNAQAQQAVIKGIIKDKESTQALKEVYIAINKSNDHTHTDEQGRFFFTGIADGSYTLEIEKTGYEKQLLQVEVLPGDTIRLEVLLQISPVSLSEVAIAADKPVSAASSVWLSQLNFNKRPKNSAQDLLRLVPGLFIAQHAGGGKAEQIFIRGFDCDHGTDVATFVDGIPVNMPSHGHGQGYADLHFLIPEVVEGMRIFKGTSSPLYGDFATGAAVSFKTLDTLPHNLLQFETGSVPSTNAITANRALALLKIPRSNNQVSSYFSADVVSNRGYFEHPQDLIRMNLFSKTTIALNENNRLQFAVSGFGSSWNASGQIPERAVKSGVISRFGAIDPTEGGTTQRNNYNLIYNSGMGGGEFESQVYACTYRFRLFSNFTFFLSDSVRGDMIEQDDNRDIRGLNTRYSLDHKLGRLNNRFTMGASFRSDAIENQLWRAPQRQRLKAVAHAQIHQRSSAWFMNEVFRFSDHFRVELGLRYDYFVFDVGDLLPPDSLRNNYSGYNYQYALSPKLNLMYSPGAKVQFFLNAGRGFHSNDARSSVQEPARHRLSLALSAEAGSLLHFGKTTIALAIWAMDLGNELVYVGDEGTTENRGASRRYGLDVSGRAQLLSWLSCDVDLNLSKSRFMDTLHGRQLKEGYYIPLAPVFTTSGGFTAKFSKGLECNLCYRYMHDRPANETNTVVAQGYQVADISLDYKTIHYKTGLTIENVLNTKWNEAQFDTTTRLKNEKQPVSELHFTPGTPFFAKLTLAYLF